MIKKKPLHSASVGNKFKNEKSTNMKKAVNTKEPKNKKFKQAVIDGEKIKPILRSKSNDQIIQNKKKFKQAVVDGETLKPSLKSKSNVQVIQNKKKLKQVVVDGETLNPSLVSKVFKNKKIKKKKFKKAVVDGETLKSSLKSKSNDKKIQNKKKLKQVVVDGETLNPNLVSKSNDKKLKNKKFKQAVVDGETLKPSLKSESNDKIQNKEKLKQVVVDGEALSPSLVSKSNDKKLKNKKFKQAVADGAKLKPSWKSKSNDKKFQNYKKLFNTKSNKYEKPTFHKQYKDKKFVETKIGEKGELNKGTKRKSEKMHEGSDIKKVKLFHLKKKERKVIRQKNENKYFELAKQIKFLWEEARRTDCQLERKRKLIGDLFKLVQGHVKELVFAHDTVLVLKFIVATGTNDHRSSLFDELKDDIIPLAKSEYGKGFLFRMLQHGNHEHKAHILNCFRGKVIELIKHKDASDVVEAAFHECTNASQKSEFVEDFYGPHYKLIKGSEPQSLQKLFDENPENKSKIMNHMKEVLLLVVEKSGVKHSIIHYLLQQFMEHCDDVSRAEIMEPLREHVAEILHSRDGSNVAMQCVWHGTAKDRKVIVKHLKPFVIKAAMEEYGHMVLLALFDCVDDTILLEKEIIMELGKNAVNLSENLYGRKVLIYLLSPREHHYFCPRVINILKEGDNNPSSKKEPQFRHSELKRMIEQPLLQLITSKMSSKYIDNSFCLFVLTVLKHVSGSSKADIFKVIAEIASESYSTENVHIIENPGSTFLLKKLILENKNINKEESDEALFSKILVDNVPEGIMKTWIDCNRGCFLLVSLIESGIPSVIERIRSEMDGLKNTLAKKSFKGSEILIKKLKECT